VGNVKRRANYYSLPSLPFTCRCEKSSSMKVIRRHLNILTIISGNKIIIIISGVREKIALGKASNLSSFRARKVER
jgi:hypothetical protein